MGLLFSQVLGTTDSCKASMAEFMHAAKHWGHQHPYLLLPHMLLLLALLLLLLLLVFVMQLLLLLLLLVPLLMLLPGSMLG